MRATYSAETLKAYIRSTETPNEYYFCEVGDDRRYDLRRGVAQSSLIPLEFREKADLIKGKVFSNVEVPKNLFEKVVL